MVAGGSKGIYCLYADSEDLCQNYKKERGMERETRQATVRLKITESIYLSWCAGQACRGLGLSLQHYYKLGCWHVDLYS